LNIYTGKKILDKKKVTIKGVNCRPFGRKRKSSNTKKFGIKKGGAIIGVKPRNQELLISKPAPLYRGCSRGRGAQEKMVKYGGEIGTKNKQK